MRNKIIGVMNIMMGFSIGFLAPLIGLIAVIACTPFLAIIFAIMRTCEHACAYTKEVEACFQLGMRVARNGFNRLKKEAPRDQ